MRDLSFAAIARLRLLCGNRVDSMPVWCYVNEHRGAGRLEPLFTARTATPAGWLCCAGMSRVNLCARSVLHVQSTYERSRWLELSGIAYIPLPSPHWSSRRIPITDVRDRNLSTQAESDARHIVRRLLSSRDQSLTFHLSPGARSSILITDNVPVPVLSIVVRVDFRLIVSSFQLGQRGGDGSGHPRFSLRCDKNPYLSY
jgi:hypothetical protein